MIRPLAVRPLHQLMHLLLINALRPCKAVNDFAQVLARQVACAIDVLGRKSPHCILLQQFPKRLKLGHHLNEVIIRDPVHIADSSKVQQIGCRLYACVAANVSHPLRKLDAAPSFVLVLVKEVKQLCKLRLLLPGCPLQDGLGFLRGLLIVHLCWRLLGLLTPLHFLPLSLVVSLGDLRQPLVLLQFRRLHRQALQSLVDRGCFYPLAVVVETVHLSTACIGGTLVRIREPIAGQQHRLCWDLDPRIGHAPSSRFAAPVRLRPVRHDDQGQGQERRPHNTNLATLIRWLEPES
mmetsp:Transcript_86009/g.199985  ORF Transcript_86009/g.199985 Transcript_86009/m.199985 type:complete len:293 (-) Transcript_86009:21-899(-)